MIGYLYAVVFDEGTVKVGMTAMKLHCRISEHVNMGKRFGINVHAVFWRIFDYADLAKIETRLKWKYLHGGLPCRRAWGEEWFSFDSVEDATKETHKTFDEMKASAK